jgi:type VI secretion system secreted protein VgrG
LGIKAFAARGKVQVQAQSDELEVFADQVAKFISAKKSIQIAAKDEVLLTAKGSYIKVNSAGIEQGTPATHIVYAATKAMLGPRSLDFGLPKFSTKNQPLELNYHWPDLSPVVGAPYYVVFDNGAEFMGHLDSKGYAKIDNPPDGDYEVWLGEDTRVVDAQTNAPAVDLSAAQDIDPELAAQIEQFVQTEDILSSEGGVNE